VFEAFLRKVGCLPGGSNKTVAVAPSTCLPTPALSPKSNDLRNMPCKSNNTLEPCDGYENKQDLTFQLGK